MLELTLRQKKYLDDEIPHCTSDYQMVHCISNLPDTVGPPGPPYAHEYYRACVDYLKANAVALNLSQEQKDWLDEL